MGTTEGTVSAELKGQEHDRGAGEPQAEIPHSLENGGSGGDGIAPKATGPGESPELGGTSGGEEARRGGDWLPSPTEKQTSVSVTDGQDLKGPVGFGAQGHMGKGGLAQRRGVASPEVGEGP